MNCSPAGVWRLQRARYRLEGSQCPECGDVQFPPREICPECAYLLFAEAGEKKHEEVSIPVDIPVAVALLADVSV